MNRLTMYTIFCIAFRPLLTAQRSQRRRPQLLRPPTSFCRQRRAGRPMQCTRAPPRRRNQAIKKARTIFISSETAYLTVSTLDRALLKQKNWDRLGLNIVDNTVGADLELKVDRLVLTHIHTYVLTDKATGIVLASGRVRAFDGVVASDPMAEQIVSALSAVQADPAGLTRSAIKASEVVRSKLPANISKRRIAMIRKPIQCAFVLILCPMLVAQQIPPATANSGTPQTLPENPQRSAADQSRWNRVRTFTQGDKIAVTTRSGETYRCTVTAPSDAGLACSYMRGYPAEQNYEFMRDDILEGQATASRAGYRDYGRDCFNARIRGWRTAAGGGRL